MRQIKFKGEKMYCRKCGKELQDDWNICPNCGAKVQGDEKTAGAVSEEAHERPGKKIWRKWQFWLGIIALLIVIAAVVVIVLAGVKEKKPTTVSNQEKIIEQEETKPKEITDFSQQDFSEVLNKSEDDMEGIGLIAGQDVDFYTGLEGNLEVRFQDGQVQEILIAGDETLAPKFHGAALGSTKEDAQTQLEKIYPDIQETADGLKFINVDTKESVECTLENNKVSKVHYVRLSDEEIEAIRAAEEEKIRAEYIFPDSDKKYLSEDEIRTKTVDEMLIGRNEIFARHGYIFTDENLKNHFEGTSWYKGTVPAEQFNSDQVFNDFEKKNVELIKQIEDEINGVADSEVTGTDGEEFIGRNGAYVCTDPNLYYSGRIEINRTGNTADFRLDVLNYDFNYDLITGSAEVINSNTIQINSYGSIITCTWSDSEHMYVTNSYVYEGMDGAVIDDTTNGRNYIYSVEFNR